MIQFPGLARALMLPDFAGASAPMSDPVTYIPPDSLLASNAPQAPALPAVPDFLQEYAPAPDPVPMPAPPLQAGTDREIGIAQEPEVRAELRDALLGSLLGLKSERARQQKEIDREGVDRFNANILYPLTGFIPGNQETALEASKDLLKLIEDRKKTRRDVENTKVELINNLGKFIRGADPEDWENVITREKETRLQGEAVSRDQARKQRALNATENTELRRQGLAQKAKRDAAYIEHIKNGDQNAKLRTEQYIKNSEAQIQQRKDDLREHIREANMRNDVAELRLAQQELREVHNEENELRDFELKVIQAEDEAKFKTAKANQVDGEPINYTPPTAAAVKEKVNNAVGKPQQGAPVLGDIQKRRAAIQKAIQQKLKKQPKPAPGKPMQPKMDMTANAG